MVGDEQSWFGIALGGFVFAALAFAVAVIVASRRGGLARFISGAALGGAGFVGAIVATWVTYRPPAAARVGEAFVPVTWGIAWGFYAFGVGLLAVVLTLRAPKKA